jgi:chromosome segregation ATPase
VPADEEGRETLFSLSGLVWSIQRALRSLGVVLARLAGHQDLIQRVTAGNLDVAVQIDEARRRRGAVDTKIEAYRKAHPWEVLAKRTFGQGEQGVPRRLRNLQHDRESQQRQVDDLKRSRKVTAEQLAALRVEERQLGEEEARHRGRLERTVGEFMALEPKAAPALLAVLPDEHRVMVEPLLLVSEPKGKVALPVPAPRLALDIPRPRPR